MSVDLNFWNYKEGTAHDDNKIYETACCNGETVDGLESLPINEIFEKIAAAFSGWTALDKNNYIKDGHGAFQVFTTSQIIRFDCYGIDGDDMNLLIDIMIGFGCPLYDPQIVTRFDEWTDR